METFEALSFKFEDRNSRENDAKISCIVELSVNNN